MTILKPSPEIQPVEITLATSQILLLAGGSKAFVVPIDPKYTVDQKTHIVSFCDENNTLTQKHIREIIPFGMDGRFTISNTPIVGIVKHLEIIPSCRILTRMAEAMGYRSGFRSSATDAFRNMFDSITKELGHSSNFYNNPQLVYIEFQSL